jgi:hypothetical protein
MARACIFCGDTSSTLSSEHIFPDWITGFYSDRVAGPLRGTIEFAYPSGENKSFRGIPFQQKVRTVCRKCNNGWMSALESHIRPYLSKMLVGERTRLRSNAQRNLAFWCAKTAFVLQYINTVNTIIPESHYFELYSLQSALPSQFIVISSRGIPRHQKGLPMMQAMSERVIYAKADASLGSSAQEQMSQWVREGHRAYKVTFAIGNFVAQVFGHDLPATFGIAGGGPAISLWPNIRNRVDWSLNYSIDDLGGIIPFHRMFAAPPAGSVGLDYFTKLLVNLDHLTGMGKSTPGDYTDHVMGLF